MTRLFSRAGRSIFTVKKPNTRKLLVILHDLLATPAALLASFYIRFEGAGLDTRRDLLLWFIPAFTLFAGLVYHLFGLYESKWRFASLPDLSNIFRAATVLALSLVVLDYVLASSAVYGAFFFGKITIILYWFLQMFFLGGSRIAYRYFRFTRTRRHAARAGSSPCLVLGRAADAELVMRSIESGAVKRIWPLGVLSPSNADQGMVVRNMRVLGTFDDLETAVADLESRGTPVKQLILTASALDPESQPELILSRARRLGIDVRHLAGIEESGGLSAPAVRLTKIDVEDLLLRPSVKIDYGRLERFVRGKAVAVTGGGGSIGSEICSRVATFGASRILVVENSEPALWAVLEKLGRLNTGAVLEGRIADVRDRNRMFRLLGAFKPDLVFHAAALKHVQLVEREWTEGLRTNVFGSVNIADAAVAAGAKIMVMISTDKAIEPVSILGATKRMAEMYCQALNAELTQRQSAGSVVPMNREAAPTRLISVRFGNVLASNGSVVPRFRAQIEAGGPVTVTHPDMVRYFMTVREATDLVVTAASHAGGPQAVEESVYVLNMGQPVRIVDLAERMIRLSGYEPGRDIEIAFTGIRPGERLNEILFAEDEPVSEVGIPGIVAAVPPCPSHQAMLAALAALQQSLHNDERDGVARVFRDTVPDYRGAAA